VVWLYAAVTQPKGVRIPELATTLSVVQFVLHMMMSRLMLSGLLAGLRTTGRAASVTKLSPWGQYYYKT
jgi:hypothetical protein